MAVNRRFVLAALLLLSTSSLPACGGAASSAATMPRPVYLDADLPTLIEIANAWTGAALRADGQLRLYWAGDPDSGHVSTRMIATRSGGLNLNGRRTLVGQIFELISNGLEFELKIPDHSAVYTGMSNTPAEPDPQRPYFALRPQHMTEALLPEPLPTTSTLGSYVLLQEYPERYGLVWMMVDNAEAVVRRKVWIERVDLRVSEIEVFDYTGKIDFIALYSNYLGAGRAAYPGTVEVRRPWDELTFRFDLDDAQLNPTIPAVAFQFKPAPPGYRSLTIQQALAEFRARGGES